MIFGTYILPNDLPKLSETNIDRIERKSSIIIFGDFSNLL